MDKSSESKLVPKRFYYFNSTHWDREWYQPLQNYRRYLVQTTERIMKTLEGDAEVKEFTFDGQTIVLEDVCEIHPEWRVRLEKLIQSGRLNVGPWYVMPDEFLCTGEGLIRNLLIGKELSESFGHAPWPVLYVCDIFGHMAQLPQLAIGFGTQPIVIWRGTRSDFPPYFWWESPDGERCPTMKLASDSGYCTFSLKVTGVWDVPMDEAEFKSRFAKMMELIGPYFGEGVVLSDGCDHQQLHAQAPQYLKWIQEMYPKAKVLHSNYTELLEEFKAKRPTIAGELIHTCDHEPNNATQIPHTLSSRYDIKQGEDTCADQLEQLADILESAAAYDGQTEMFAFWKYAWKQLIKNHPHDSICGCSIDAIYHQMLARFEEIQQVIEEIAQDARVRDFEARTGVDIRVHVDDRRPNPAAQCVVDPEGKYQLRLYNPLPWDREEVVELEVPFPADAKYPKHWSEPFGYESLNAFRLYDEAGKQLEYQFTGPIRRHQLRRVYRVMVRNYDLYPVAVKLQLRASGWTTVSIRPSDTAVRFQVSQLTSRTSTANGRLELSVNPDGTIDLADRQTGRAYHRLNQLVFDREIGDGWNAVRPQGAPTQVAGGVVEAVKVLTDGPNETTFEVTTSYQLPRELIYQGGILEDYEGVRESDELEKLTVKCAYTLAAGADEVRVHTTLVNTIRDYRVRLVMPTGIPGDYYAFQNFAVLKRAPGRAAGRGTEDWNETEPPEKNFSRIAYKRDAEGNGLAFIAKAGLHELSADTDAAGALVVTLRAFRRTVQTNGETEGQLLKPLAYDYAFRVLAPQDTNGGLLRAAQALRAASPVQYALAASLVRSDAAPDVSWLKLEGDLALSALKPAQDGAARTVIVRVEALSDHAVKGALVLAKPARITPVRLDETPIGTAGKAVTRLDITAAPWKLQSYRLEF